MLPMPAAPTEPFIPLATEKSASTATRNFRVLVAEHPERARNISADASAGALAGHASARPGCNPRVRVEREGDRVTGIRIECSCGQVIDLVCRYGAPQL